MRARALLMTNRFCIPTGARYARPSVSPWINTDSKSTDIPYRPSKARSIARCTTLLMIAYGDACGGGGGEPHRHAGAPPSPVYETEQARNASRRVAGARASGNAASSSIPSAANLQCFGVMFNVS